VIEHNERTETGTSSPSYVGLLLFLMVVGALLAVRLGYVYLSDANRFPVTTIKVAASYQVTK
jgi:cell division protein FtsQ